MELAGVSVVFKGSGVAMALNRRLSLVLLVPLAACAGKAKTDVNVAPPPVEHIEMDPIKISAVLGPDGVHL